MGDVVVGVRDLKPDRKKDSAVCIKNRFLVMFSAVFVFGGTFSFGSVFYIPHNGIADHGDASSANSIAWYFQTYGAGNTYVLTTSNTYYNIGSTLTVPDNAILRGNSNWLVKIAALDSVDNMTLVDLGGGSQLYNLYINGARRPNCLVRISGKNSVTVDRCTMFDSKNDYTSGNPYTMLVFCIDSSDVTVRNCLLRRAGCNPKVNPHSWEGLGYGILSRNCRNMVFQNNDIAQTLTGGIDITGSASVQVLGNYIGDTGLNREYDGPISDGITGYHNLIGADENFTIMSNSIVNAQNHGIHVSGRWINIQDNIVSNQQLSGIMVDDWRSPNEYSENVIVSNNLCGDPLSWVWAPGNSNRKIFVDRVNANSGCVLEYEVNKDLNGVPLPVTPDNYRFPSSFGSHSPTPQERYDEWGLGYGLTNGTESLMADPDSDRMNNLVEYGLGGNPTQSDAAGTLPTCAMLLDGSLLAYAYNRRLDADERGLTYTIEMNTNLVGGVWMNGGMEETGTEVLDADFEVVTNAVPLDADKKFLRLLIEMAD